MAVWNRADGCRVVVRAMAPHKRIAPVLSRVPIMNKDEPPSPPMFIRCSLSVCCQMGSLDLDLAPVSKFVVPIIRGIFEAESDFLAGEWREFDGHVFPGVVFVIDDLQVQQLVIGQHTQLPIAALIGSDLEIKSSLL